MKSHCTIKSKAILFCTKITVIMQFDFIADIVTVFVRLSNLRGDWTVSDKLPQVAPVETNWSDCEAFAFAIDSVPGTKQKRCVNNWPARSNKSGFCPIQHNRSVASIAEPVLQIVLKWSTNRESGWEKHMWELNQENLTTSASMNQISGFHSKTGGREKEVRKIFRHFESIVKLRFTSLSLYSLSWVQRNSELVASKITAKESPGKCSDVLQAVCQAGGKCTG